MPTEKKSAKPAKATRKRTCGARRSIKRPATVGARVTALTPPEPLPMPLPAPVPETATELGEPLPPPTPVAEAEPPVELLYMLKGQTAPETPLAPTAATAAMAETEEPPSAPTTYEPLAGQPAETGEQPATSEAAATAPAAVSTEERPAGNRRHDFMTENPQPAAAKAPVITGLQNGQETT
ncbi:MAG: hypothetical protein UU95_C0042G0002 [Parcubacteria group bacterium GW2011_GWC2_42_12]|nr:MAG: hypothetical protein UU95_C0042G0002 [Parcubacteria group bacterium GW2011_GWC2_42_12]KKT44255.1 MAG: hypothetical protein UW34_C0013G0009 [Parcubacteria group bacterium GW2011_GWA2_44_15]